MCSITQVVLLLVAALAQDTNAPPARLLPYMELFLPPDYEIPVPLPFHLDGLFPVHSRSDLLFYLHMPKTAGQAFHRVLARSVRGCDMSNSTCNPVRLGPDVSEEQFIQSRLPARFDLTFAPKKEDAQLLRQPGKIQARFGSYSAALGHVDVSFATQFPHRRVIFMTMLRDPVSRVTSMFNYMTGMTSANLRCLEALNRGMMYYPNPKSKAVSSFPQLVSLCSDPMVRRRILKNVSRPFFAQKLADHFEDGIRFHSAERPFILGPSSLPSNMSFPHFLEALEILGYDNYMTRAVAGKTTRSFLDDSNLPLLSKRETLQLAKRMLMAFPFVGLTERFADSVELYLWTFGFPYSSLGSEFVFNKSKNKAELQAEDAELVKQMDYLDIQLYEFGVKLFEKRFARMKQDKLLRGVP